MVAALGCDIVTKIVLQPCRGRCKQIAAISITEILKDPLQITVRSVARERTIAKLQPSFAKLYHVYGVEDLAFSPSIAIAT